MGGQAAGDDISRCTMPPSCTDARVGSRKNMQRRESSGNAAAGAGDKRSAMQMVKQRERKSSMSMMQR